MYTPDYNSALFSLNAELGFDVGYYEYVEIILHRKHYGKTRKYRI